MRLDEAERSVQRSIELDPNLAEGYGGLGNVVDFAGQHQRALPLFERAMRLDPQFDIWIQAYGRAQYALERYDDAEATFKRRLIRMPRSDVRPGIGGTENENWLSIPAEYTRMIAAR